MTRRNDDLDRYDLNRLRATPADDEAHAAALRAHKKSKSNGIGAKPKGAGPFVQYPVEVIYRMGRSSMPARRSYSRCYCI